MENSANKIIPIQELTGKDGRLLAGNEMGRENVYMLVRNFEKNNAAAIRHPVIAPDGSYEDRDFLYSAYDEYVAMSHAGELAPYRRYFDNAVKKTAEWARQVGYTPNIEQLYNERLAEVYYAKQAGLREEQIAVVIGDGNRAIAQMRSLRKLYEAGFPQEQIDTLSQVGSIYTAEYAADFLQNGGNVEVVKAMPPDTDMTTAYYTFQALGGEDICDRDAVCIFEASRLIRSFNEQEYAKEQRENPDGARHRFGAADLDYITSCLTEMAGTKGKNVGGEAILATVSRWLKNGATIPLGEQPVVSPEDNVALQMANHFSADELQKMLESRAANPQPDNPPIAPDEYVRAAISVHERRGKFPQRYVDEKLNLRGTAASLYRRVQAGAISSLDALEKIQSILRVEGMAAEAANVGKAKSALSAENNPLKTVEAVEQRIAEIDAENKEMDDRQYQYGYMRDKMYGAKLYREKRELRQVLEIVANYTLSDVQAELDERDDVNGFDAGTGKDGLHKYSFYVLGHAETILQGQDRVLQDRIDLGENAIHLWERENGRQITYEENRRVYELIRNKEIPISRLERLISQTLSGAIGKEWVAVESTDDYPSVDFSAELVDMDVQNEDGTYGKIVERYRVVTIGADSRLVPIDKRVFASRAEAVASVEDNPAYHVVSYDEIVHEAMSRRMAANEKSKGRETEMEKDVQTENVDTAEKQVQKAEGAENNIAETALSPKEKLQQRLEAGVRSVMDSEKFKNWLSTSSRMFTKQYSFQNAMLVWLQKPDASFTMGYEAWKTYGRTVQKGTHGAQIYVPLMASERKKGELFGRIKKGLMEQLASNPNEQVVAYRLGNSRMEFTLNRNNYLYGIRMDGKDRGQLGGEAEVRRFIERSVLGKIPYGFTVGTVFDVKDTAVPEFLWVKKGYTADEVVKDAKGRPVKNRFGEVKIHNTKERQARFQPGLDMSVKGKDPEQMEKLFAACVAASERKGVPVYLRDKSADGVLAGGASGYFSREFTPELPKGFIVIDNGLTPTEKCSVLMHEMSHADLHANIERLNERMGERATRQMREVQAEASAFAVASQFGITTDTSSFSYIAAYSTGFQLQEFQKSLELIYKEARELTADIKAELDLRGLNMDLSEKEVAPLEPGTIKVVSAKYIDFATAQENDILAEQAELPELMRQAEGSKELLDILRYQKENMETRKSEVEAMIATVEKLNKAESREEQQKIIGELDSSIVRVQQALAHFEALSESFVATNEQLRGGLKTEWENDPEKTLEKLAEDYPRLKELSAAQKEYITSSKYVNQQYVKLLRTDPMAFADRVWHRARDVAKVAAKNGTFVEVNFCERWTDKPIFANGTVCHPKIAEKTIQSAEEQIRDMRREAEEKEDYFPYAKCDITVYAPCAEGLRGWNVRVDIGDGWQSNLSSFLQQSAKTSEIKGEIAKQFAESVAERGAYKSKICVPEKGIPSAEKEKPEAENTVKRENIARSGAEWANRIKEAREQKQDKDVKEKSGRDEREQGG